MSRQIEAFIVANKRIRIVLAVTLTEQGDERGLWQAALTHPGGAYLEPRHEGFGRSIEEACEALEDTLP